MTQKYLVVIRWGSGLTYAYPFYKEETAIECFQHIGSAVCSFLYDKDMFGLYRLIGFNNREVQP